MFSFFKKQMGFKQALEEILAANMFPSCSEMIKAEIEGSMRLLFRRVGSDIFAGVANLPWPCVLHYSCGLCFIIMMTLCMFLFSV
jgi:hypothetical protein